MGKIPHVSLRIAPEEHLQYIRWITTFSVNCREMHLHEYQIRLSKFLRTHLQDVLK